MKLLELDPRWLIWQGRRVGMMLRCPHCRKTWLSCFFEKMPVLCGEPNQFSLFKKAIDPGENAHNVVPCRKDFAWTRVGDDFATMSITPSLDASASGHWHGFITAGEIK